MNQINHCSQLHTLVNAFYPIFCSLFRIDIRMKLRTGFSICIVKTAYNRSHHQGARDLQPQEIFMSIH